MSRRYLYREGFGEASCREEDGTDWEHRPKYAPGVELDKLEFVDITRSHARNKFLCVALVSEHAR